MPVEDIVSPVGSPVAEKVYGPPEPPFPTIVTGAVAKPWTAWTTTQVLVGAPFTVTEQLNVPTLLYWSLIVTV